MFVRKQSSPSGGSNSESTFVVMACYGYHVLFGSSVLFGIVVFSILPLFAGNFAVYVDTLGNMQHSFQSTRVIISVLVVFLHFTSMLQ